MTLPSRARTSDTPKLELRLADLPASTLAAIPAALAEAVPVLWADRAPMLLDPSALGPLARWERQLNGSEPPSDPGRRPEGPGRTPYEAPHAAPQRTAGHAEARRGHIAHRHNSIFPFASRLHIRYRECAQSFLATNHTEQPQGTTKCTRQLSPPS